MVQSSGNFCRRIVIALFIQICLSSAECECGYRVPYGGDSSGQPRTSLFTDVVQTDFRQMRSIDDSDDWKIRDLRLEYEPDKPRFGRIVEERNVVLNPLLANLNSSSGPNIDAGLQLVVRSALVEDNLVSTGQIQSKREDIRFGSFRAYMKTSPINGTCAASFWYHNDTQEIDIELLSRQQKAGQNPINLSVQSKESLANDNDPTNTTGFIQPQLGFDPAEGYHEYRYDWSPEVVSFYTDGSWMGDIHDNIPSTPGYFQLSHWSNGFQKWTAGPPPEDALITVVSFMGFFNTTNEDRVKDFESRCGGGRGASSVCDVPNTGMLSKASQGPDCDVTP